MASILNPTGFNIKKKTEKPIGLASLPSSELPPLNLGAPETEGLPPIDLWEIPETPPPQLEGPEIPWEELPYRERLIRKGIDKSPEELTRQEALAYLYNVAPEDINEVSKRLYALQAKERGMPEFLTGIARFGRAMIRGVGSALNLADNFIDSKTESAEPSFLTKAGQSIINTYEPITVSEWEGIKSLLNPDYLTEALGEQVGVQLPLLVFGVGGTVGAAKMLTSMGFSKLGAGVIGSAVGTLMSRPLESMMEGGSAYEQAIQEGKSKEEASEIANEVFGRNLALFMSDWAQYFLPLTLGGGVGGSALGRGLKSGLSLLFGSITEGTEEIIQQYMQNTAAGKATIWDKQMEEQAVMGALFGSIFAGTEIIADRYANKEQRKIAKENAQKALNTILQESGKPAVVTTPVEPAPTEAEPTAQKLDLTRPNSIKGEPSIYPVGPTFSIEKETPSEIKAELTNIENLISSQGFPPQEQGGIYPIKIGEGVGLAPGIAKNYSKMLQTIRKDPIGNIYAPGNIGQPLDIGNGWYFSNGAIFRGKDIKKTRSPSERVKTALTNIVKNMVDITGVAADPVYYFNINPDYTFVSKNPIPSHSRPYPAGVMFRTEIEGQKVFIGYPQQPIQYLNKIYDNISWEIVPTEKNPILLAKADDKIIGGIFPLKFGERPGTFFTSPPYGGLLTYVNFDPYNDKIELRKPKTKIKAPPVEAQPVKTEVTPPTEPVPVEKPVEETKPAEEEKGEISPEEAPSEEEITPPEPAEIKTEAEPLPSKSLTMKCPYCRKLIVISERDPFCHGCGENLAYMLGMDEEDYKKYIGQEEEEEKPKKKSSKKAKAKAEENAVKNKQSKKSQKKPRDTGSANKQSFGAKVDRLLKGRGWFGSETVLVKGEPTEEETLNLEPYDMPETAFKLIDDYSYRYGEDDRLERDGYYFDGEDVTGYSKNKIGYAKAKDRAPYLVLKHPKTGEYIFLNQYISNVILNRYPDAVPYGESDDKPIIFRTPNGETVGLLMPIQLTPSHQEEVIKDYESLKRDVEGEKAPEERVRGLKDIQQIKEDNQRVKDTTLTPKRTIPDKTASYNVAEEAVSDDENREITEFWETIHKEVTTYKEKETGAGEVIPGTEGKTITDVRWDFQTAANLHINKIAWVNKLVTLANQLGITKIRINAKMKERGEFSYNMATGELRIDVNELYNYSTLLHEVGHLFDYAVLGKGGILDTLTARVGVKENQGLERLFKLELARCSDFFEKALVKSSPRFMRYRALTEELFTQWFVVYNLHPKAAYDMAPNFTELMETKYPQILGIRDNLKIDETLLDNTKFTHKMEGVLRPIRGFFLRAFGRIPGVELPSPIEEEKGLASVLYNQLLSMPMWKSIFSNNPNVRGIFKSVINNVVYGHNAKVATLFEKYQINQLKDLPRDSKVRIAQWIDFGNRPGGEIMSPEQLAERGLTPEEIRSYYQIQGLISECKQLLIERLKIITDYDRLKPEEKAAFDEKIQEDLNRIKGYIPLSRRGKYFVFAGNERIMASQRPEIEGLAPDKIADAKVSDVYLSGHKSYEEAFKEAEVLKKMGYDYVKVYQPRELLAREAKNIFRLSIYELDNLVEAAGLDLNDPSIRQVTDFLRSKDALNKHFLRRRQIPGYKIDLDEFMHSLADFTNLSSRRYYQAVAYQQGMQYLKEINPQHEPETYVYWKNYLDQSLFSSDKEFLGVRRAVSTWFLAFSFTYLTQQILQNLYCLYPMIALHQKGLNVEKTFIKTQAEALKYISYRLRKRPYPDPVLNELIERGIKSKAISGQFIQSVYGAFNEKSTHIQNVLHVFGIQTEFFNKLHAAMAGYEIATKTLHLSDKEAIYDFMIDTINKSTYLYGKYNAPPFLNQKGMVKQLIRLFFLFKSTHINYAHQFVYIMKNGSMGAKVRTILPRALTMGMFRALPMGAALWALIRALSKLLTGEDPEDELLKLQASKDPKVRDLTKMLTYGVGGLFNMDWRDVLDIGSIISPTFDPATQLFGPAYGVLDNINDAIDLIQRGKIEQAIAKLTPRISSNAITADIWRKEGKQVQNDLILKFSDVELIMKGVLGLTPLRLKQEYHINEMIKGLNNDYTISKSRAEEKMKSMLRLAESDPAMKNLINRALLGDIHALGEILGPDLRERIEKNNKRAMEILTIAPIVTGDPQPLKVITTNVNKYTVTYGDVQKWLTEKAKEYTLFKKLPKGR